MKTILLSAALLLAPAAAVLAQAPSAPAAQTMAAQPGHHRSPHKVALRMEKRLGLSADQEAKLEPIVAERQQKVAAIRSNTQLTDAERHQQLKAVHRDSLQQMSSVLTPDQMQQMRAMHKARHAATAPSGV